MDMKEFSFETYKHIVTFSILKPPCDSKVPTLPTKQFANHTVMIRSSICQRVCEPYC